MFTSLSRREIESPEVLGGGLYREVIASVIDMQIFAGEWEDLFSKVEGVSLCAHPEWTIAWWRNFGQQRLATGEETQPYILTFRDQTRQLIGVVPLYEDQPKSKLRIRRLRSMGYLGRERAYDMTEEPTVLVKPGFESHVCKGVQRHLRTELERGRWDFVALINPIEMSINDEDAWKDVAFVRSDLRTGSDFIELPSTWAEYRKQLSKSMRENLPYYPRLLNRDGHQWELRSVESPDEIPEAIDRLASLHQGRAESSRGRQHSNHLHTEIQTGFFREFMTTMANQKAGFVIELLIGGVVIASQAFYGWDETLTVSYSGFDEAFYRYSPIFIIHAMVFKDALERGISKLNLLRNIAQWKTRWLARTGESISRVYLVNRHPISVVRYLSHTIRIGIERDLILRVPVLYKRFVRTLKRFVKSSRELLP